jgi:Domain of unknown function (DUF1918)
MSAREGLILVDRRVRGGSVRRGRILEALGEPPCVRYRVRWDNGRESIVYPGSDATIVGVKKETAERTIQERTASARRPESRPAAQAGGTRPALRATVGDRLVIRPQHLGEPERDAEILEVIGRHGAPPYKVRWVDDNRETVLFPGADAFVEHFEHAETPAQGFGLSARAVPVHFSSTYELTMGQELLRRGNARAPGPLSLFDAATRRTASSRGRRASARACSEARGHQSSRCLARLEALTALEGWLRPSGPITEVVSRRVREGRLQKFGPVSRGESRLRSWRRC